MRVISAASTVALACALIGGGAISSASAQTPSDQALEQLTASLTAHADAGDSTAASSLTALESLDPASRNSLGSILAGPGITKAVADATPGAEVVKSDDCGVIESPIASPRALAAAKASAKTYNVTSRCSQEFKFLGVSISKTTIKGNYQTRSGRVIKTTGVHGTVDHSYEPGADISLSNLTRKTTKGKAYFEMTVTVKRSIFGWNHSTRSGNQKMRANGKNVEACYWG